MAANAFLPFPVRYEQLSKKLPGMGSSLRAPAWLFCLPKPIFGLVTYQILSEFLDGSFYLNTTNNYMLLCGKVTVKTWH